MNYLPAFLNRRELVKLLLTW